MPDRSRSRPVTDAELQAMLVQLDEVWRYFIELSPHGGRKRAATVLRVASRRGLVETRRNDISGQTEYAITEAGDDFLGRDSYSAVPARDRPWPGV
jgi:hypothetical protein